ncbi:acidic repeat-containing protein-like isoform X2 [Biomphalaria pfeifferi]|uniref:Acidic repeat-containing protein-like isoform X2 n=1 Tax=Biomphalaria pfeifferi TaxID=112525 RepID=A0AAD8EXS1_BIOPF|nr:acidic repeat-containing protein-like isoform X2 [Biomphalaria pfeifferi]
MTEDDRQKLHTFLNCMSDLTGIILLKKKAVVKNVWEYAGTGFIAKIERQRHCPTEKVPTNSPYAIVTITTAYHTFNDYREGTKEKFEAVNEIWNKMKTCFVLNHNYQDTNEDDDSANDTQHHDSDNHSENSQEGDAEKSNKSSEEDDSDNGSNSLQENNSEKGSKSSQEDDADKDSKSSQEDDSDKGSKSSQEDDFDKGSKSSQEDDADIGSTSSDGISLDHIDVTNKLIGDRLIETDKDLEFENDWCAFECVVDDSELIGKLENLVNDYQKLMAELYKKSQERMYKDVNLVVIFGHPHQWAKRMSVGKTRDFASAPKRKILKEVRSNQIWCRYSYDNATCKGSSGSPIFIWGQPISGLGYWFGHPHNHSGNQLDKDEGVYIGKSTIGVEHIV